MAETSEATSPATAPAAETGDAQRSVIRSGNISSDQAAAQLFASAERQAKQQPVQPAAEENPPEKSEQTTEKPAAEAADASVETASEETAPADQDTAGQETEETADTVHSQTSTFTPEQQKIFDKRLGKEVGKRKALEARLAELETQQAELQEKLAAPSEPNPAAAANVAPAQTAPIIAPGGTTGHPLVDKASSPAELETLSDNANTAIGFAEDALDDPSLGHDLADTISISGKDWTRGELIGLRKNAREALQAIPKKGRQLQAQSQFFSAKEQATKIAREKFPFLADKKSPEYQQAQAMLRDPWLQMRPDAEFIVGVQIRGLAALEAENAAKRTATDKPKPKPASAIKPSPDQTAVSASASAARAPVGASNRQAINAERQKFNEKKGVTTADAIAHLTRMDQLRKSR